MSEKAAALCAEGLELMTQHRWEEAEEKMELALEEDPKSPELWYNLGKCQFHLDKFRVAVSALCSAISLRMGEPSEEGIEYPVRTKNYPEAQALLGSCYYALHNTYGAQTHFSAAVHPDNPPEFNKECKTASAHAQLARGKYDSYHWYSYQQRLAEPDTWDGNESLRGKTLLIKAEGGLGDQIFFARYSEFFKKMDHGYVLWEVDEPLADYFKWDLSLEVVVRGKEVPEHDLMIHAGSLPYVFGTKPGTIPTFCNNQYYRRTGDELKHIGLAWSGNPLHPDDHHRSIPLAAFAPLFTLGKNFYPMQKEIPHRDHRPYLMTGMSEPNYENVYQLADSTTKLDLIITVDTMTAHLAGAEGIPTILLLPYACDWRWGLEGDRTPWYPSIKIIRQGEDRQWEPVIQKVLEELNG